MNPVGAARALIRPPTAVDIAHRRMRSLANYDAQAASQSAAGAAELRSIALRHARAFSRHGLLLTLHSTIDNGEGVDKEGGGG
jgi:hypothetical protein